MRAALPIVVLVALSLPVAAQETTELEKLTELSLEDLLSLRLPDLVSVLGSHVHNEGELMPMLMHRRMRMSGLRIGTRDVNADDVLLPGGTFMAAPTRMTTEMTMLGIMSGQTDNLTLSIMLPWIEKEMDHVTAMGGNFTTKSSGPGDLRFGADYLFEGSDESSLLLNMAMTVPTGSTNARDATPAGPDVRLPYPMQLGSGTFDLIPGLTWQHEDDLWSIGCNVQTVLRLGRGDNGYSLGNQYHAGLWVNRMVTDELAARVRLEGSRWLNVDGSDPEQVPTMVPTADPDLRAGTRVDLSLGLGTLIEGTGESSWTLDLEYGVPIYEDLDGPALSLDSWVGLSFTLTL